MRIDELPDEAIVIIRKLYNDLYDSYASDSEDVELILLKLADSLATSNRVKELENQVNELEDQNDSLRYKLEEAEYETQQLQDRLDLLQ